MNGGIQKEGWYSNWLYIWEVIVMMSPELDAFGSEFLPGKDREPKDVTMRAMERRFSGMVATPINSAKPSWLDGIAEHDAPRKRH